jgi:fumarate hydratase class II
MSSDYRVERDSMGEVPVPAEAYYGASTMRAALNFPISSLRFERRFLRALGLVKLAAVRTNLDLGLLDPGPAEAIAAAALEVAEGHFDSQFVVDVFQSGSGTSSNMNANEVIARRAGELLSVQGTAGAPHPNDHVNLCQSSNDVIPTTIRIAALLGVEEDLLPALDRLCAAVKAKSVEFWPVVKTGRTHLQDATPMRLGQEFLGHAGQL